MFGTSGDHGAESIKKESPDTISRCGGFSMLTCSVYGKTGSSPPIGQNILTLNCPVPVHYSPSTVPSQIIFRWVSSTLSRIGGSP
jgi:hypothetical protein